MTWADYVIIAILAVSTLISFFRGFVREALSLATWVAALWVALSFSPRVAEFLSRWIETPSIRSLVAILVLFLLVLLAGGILSFLVSALVEKTGMSGTDRALGMIFGLVRGVVLVGVLVLLAGLTPAPRDPWWQASRLMPYFVEVAQWMRGWLPPDVADDIRL
ncbi:MAG: CvpA family protein [Gammaproteobacteria bacterium]|nr:MAG: CvpA family protein [Gammaproteobacteria bacterium]